MPSSHTFQLPKLGRCTWEEKKTRALVFEYSVEYNLYKKPAQWVCHRAALCNQDLLDGSPH